MARQAITNPKRLRRLEQQIGSPIERALVRGNTDHRIDVWTRDGRALHIWPDGTIEEATDG